MNWFAWLFRAQERKRAYTEFQRLRTAYSDQGGRVIALSARTELLRKSSGSTRKSFDFVEKTFAAATQEYAQAQTILDSLEAELARGRAEALAAAAKAVASLGPALDELERRLTAWETQWQEVPRALEEARASLEPLQRDLARCEGFLGRPIPPRRGLENLAAYLEKAGRTLLEGNPVEAGMQVQDFALARRKVESDLDQYRSGVGALEQVEGALAALRAAAAGSGGAVLALTAAEELVPRLRAALAEGRFEPFQEELLQIQRWLAQAATRG